VGGQVAGGAGRDGRQGGEEVGDRVPDGVVPGDVIGPQIMLPWAL
jgi:hypothetical protein